MAPAGKRKQQQRYYQDSLPASTLNKTTTPTKPAAGIPNVVSAAKRAKPSLTPATPVSAPKKAAANKPVSSRDRMMAKLKKKRMLKYI